MNTNLASKADKMKLIFVLALVIVQCHESSIAQDRRDIRMNYKESGLLYPNGGERIVAGQTVSFTWNRSTFPSDDLLTIEYWDFELGRWKTMSAKLPNNGTASIVMGPIGITRHRIVSERSSSVLQSSGYWEAIDPGHLSRETILRTIGMCDQRVLGTEHHLLVANEEDLVSIVRTSSRQLRVFDLNGREYEVTTSRDAQNDLFANSSKSRHVIILMPTSGDVSVPIVALVVD